jgi:phage-related protein
MEIQFLNSRAEDFINSLDKQLRNRIRKNLKLLESLGHDLKMPFPKSLGNGLFELRIVGMTHIRLMYVYKYNQIWILHIFMKKTNKIQPKEIEYARNQMKLLQ